MPKKKNDIKEPSFGAVAITTVVDTMLDINKKYGVPVMSMAEGNELEKVKSSIFSVDYATRGGLPRGRWSIAVGKESTFKSSLYYTAGGSMQRICGCCMEGHITEKDFKAVTIRLDGKDNDYVSYDKNVNKYYSKVYIANSNKHNIYIPKQIIQHKKSFKAYIYTIECDVCTTPDYSIFLLLDNEKNYTQYWAIKCGIIHGRLALARTQYTEQVGEIMRAIMDTARCSFVCVDSVPAVGPRIEDESPFLDQQMGIQPKQWNKIVRVLTSKLNSVYTYEYIDKTGKKISILKRPETHLAMIQQWREKIGMTFGNPLDMTGGWGLKYASSVTFELTRGEIIYSKETREEDKRGMKNAIGVWFNFYLSKSKITKPYTHGRFYLDLENLMLNNNESIFDKALEIGLIKRAGAWYSIGDKKFQGRDGTIEALKNKLPLLGRNLIEAVIDENI